MPACPAGKTRIRLATVRRFDKEITDINEIDEILSSAKVGRLGTSVNDKPYIVPVNFVHSGDKIFIHSAGEGHKLDNIKANPNVCFEVAEIECLLIKQPICASSAKYRSVIMFGTIRFVEDNQSKFEALKLFVEKYTDEPFTDSFTDAMLTRITVLEITVKERTAKQSPAK